MLNSDPDVVECIYDVFEEFVRVKVLFIGKCAPGVVRVSRGEIVGIGVAMAECYLQEQVSKESNIAFF